MSPSAPYLALAALPAAIILAMNPTRFSWGFRHGLQPMPVEVRDRAEYTDRLLQFVRDAITVSLVAALMHWQSTHARQVGLNLYRWKSNVTIGIEAGAVYVATASLIRLVTRIGPGRVTDYLRRGSVLSWALITLTGCFAEEFWLAFCLVCLRATGQSVSISLLLVAIASGLIHYVHRWGAVAIAISTVASGSLFLWRGSLIPSLLFHCIGNFVSFYSHRKSAD